MHFKICGKFKKIHCKLRKFKKNICGNIAKKMGETFIIAQRISLEKKNPAKNYGKLKKNG